jgi:hypothetical protein
MPRKRLKNEFRTRPPGAAEVKAAQRLAKRVDVKLLAMMESKEVK